MQRDRQCALRQRYQSLTPREAEVFALVVQGLLNKLVADRLGIAERMMMARFHPNPPTLPKPYEQRHARDLPDRP